MQLTRKKRIRKYYRYGSIRYEEERSTERCENQERPFTVDNSCHVNRCYKSLPEISLVKSLHAWREKHSRDTKV